MTNKSKQYRVMTKMCREHYILKNLFISVCVQMQYVEPRGISLISEMFALIEVKT